MNHIRIVHLNSSNVFKFFKSLKSQFYLFKLLNSTTLIFQSNFTVFIEFSDQIFHKFSKIFHKNFLSIFNFHDFSWTLLHFNISLKIPLNYFLLAPKSLKKFHFITKINSSIEWMLLYVQGFIFDYFSVSANVFIHS